LATGVAGRVLGDWKISGLLSLRSGYPFGLGSGRDSQNRFSGIGGRLNLIDDLQVAEQTLQKWFNTAAVTPPPFGQTGNLGPNPLRGPSLYNLDMSLLKTFRI